MVRADHIGASTFIEKGWSLISLGDHAGAIQALTKALQLSPGETQAESLLGWAQMLHEDYDDALGTFQKVLMKEPANSLARINVGYICLKKEIFGEAIEHLSKAIRLDNDKKATLYAHFYLGLVYLRREMYEDAETFFEKTLKLGPNLIEAYYELGRAFWFNGQQDEAKQVIQEYRLAKEDVVEVSVWKEPDLSRTVPVIDLRKRLGVEAPRREDTRTVILEFEGGKIGLVVDTVSEVMQVAAQSVTPPPNIVKGLAAEYIAGLVVQNGRTIIVLNTNKLLSAKEKLALQGAQ